MNGTLLDAVGAGMTTSSYSPESTFSFECRPMYRFYMDNVIQFVGASGFLLNVITICVLFQPGIGQNIKGT